MVIQAPAKVNLFLELLGKLPSGYHALDTVMTEISWFDTLVLEPSNESHGPIEFRVVDSRGLSLESDVPSGADNLVVRALELLRTRAGIERPLRATLIKRIPSQAGLGGGSSDAAAALRGANRLWGIDWDRARLMELAAELGSDIPFFVVGGTARCRGRGEQVEPLPVPLDLFLVVVKPPVGLGTADVYRRCTVPAQPRCGDEFCTSLRSKNPQEIAHRMFNRLAEPACGLTEWVGRLGRSFERTGCLGWLLSGSGSACFAAYAGRSAAQRAARVLQSSHELSVRVVRPLSGRATDSP